MDTGDVNDNIISNTTSIILGFATGTGSVSGATWQIHTNRNAVNITVGSCSSTGAPTTTPTVAPTVAPTAVPTVAPTLAPGNVFVSCGVELAILTNNPDFNITMTIGTDQLAQPAVQLTLQFTIPQSGFSYAAVGFKNDTIGMTGLDIYAVDSDLSSQSVTDFGLSTGNVRPVMDPHQDGFFESKTVNGSVETATFFRLLNTGDLNDVQILVNQSIVVGFAVGLGSVAGLTKHTFKGFYSLVVPSCNVVPTEVPTQVPTLVPTLSPYNTTVPSSPIPTTNAPPTLIPTQYLDVTVDTEPVWVLILFSLSLVFCLGSKLFFCRKKQKFNRARSKVRGLKINPLTESKKDLVVPVELSLLEKLLPGGRVRARNERSLKMHEIIDEPAL
eukprot:TRINITY_DN2629_c0_g1_i6.p1 TRINITY_DN2629_c0_g1~~TRINITY_DN2629_c0_g1_i6.p1  ORF type:complete len:386 (+),score=46.39 TRINITY_DN2629_c0_g1_i6:867-2024(+)